VKTLEFAHPGRQRNVRSSVTPCARSARRSAGMNRWDVGVECRSFLAGDHTRNFVIESLSRCFFGATILVDRYRPADRAHKIAHRLRDLQEDVRRVLRTLTKVEREIEDATIKARYIVRILPYRSVDNYIAGAVVTFLDVTQLTRAESGRKCGLPNCSTATPSPSSARSRAAPPRRAPPSRFRRPPRGPPRRAPFRKRTLRQLQDYAARAPLSLERHRLRNLAGKPLRQIRFSRKRATPELLPIAREDQAAAVLPR